MAPDARCAGVFAAAFAVGLFASAGRGAAARDDKGRRTIEVAVVVDTHGGPAVLAEGVARWLEQAIARVPGRRVIRPTPTERAALAGCARDAACLRRWAKKQNVDRAIWGQLSPGGNDQVVMDLLAVSVRREGHTRRVTLTIGAGAFEEPLQAQLAVLLGFAPSSSLAARRPVREGVPDMDLELEPIPGASEDELEAEAELEPVADVKAGPEAKAKADAELPSGTPSPAANYAALVPPARKPSPLGPIVRVEDSTPAPARPGATQRAGVAVAGSGTVALAVGAYFGIRTRRANARLAVIERGPDGTAQLQAIAYHDDAARNALRANVALGAGAAAVLAGAGLLLYDFAVRRPRDVVVVPGPSGRGLEVAFTW